MEKESKTCHARLFTVSDGKPVEYKGEKIYNLEIFFCFRIVDKRTGKEIPINEKNMERVKAKFDTLYRCDYSRVDGYTMTKTEETPNYQIDYEVYRCCKFFNLFEKPIVEITHNELKQILIANPTAFDTPINKPAESGVMGYFSKASYNCEE